MTDKRSISKKNTLLILLGVALALTFLTMIICVRTEKSKEKSNCLSNIMLTVEIRDGEVIDGFEDGQYWEFPVEITREDNYAVRAKWQRSDDPTANPGHLTGIVFFDKDGKVIYACTGDIVDSEGIKCHYEKGTYTVRVQRFTCQEEFEEFCDEYKCGAEASGKEFTGYIDNAEVPMEYVIGFDNGFTLSSSMVIIFGMLLGIEIGSIFVLITKKDGAIRTEYDERQELVRGRGYKLGFVTFAISSGVMFFLSFLGVEIPAEQPIVWAGCFALAMTVANSYFAWHDCFVGLNENVRAGTVLIILATVINLAIAINNTVNGNIMVNGKLGINSISYLAGIMTGTVMIVRLVRKIADRSDGEK